MSEELTHDEQIRASAVTAAALFWQGMGRETQLLRTAKKIEEYIQGKDSGKSGLTYTRV